MTSLMIRTAAIMALSLAPAVASAQGARGGADAGVGAGGGRAAAGAEGGGGHAGSGAERGGRIQGAEGREGGRDMERGGRAAERGDREGGRERKGGRDMERGDRGADRGLREGERRGERERVREGERGYERGVRAGERIDGRARVGGRRAANLTVEERTRFRTRLRGLGGGEHFRRGDFAWRTGAVVPETYRLTRLPEEIIETVPAYRGYDYGLVDDEVVIIEPGTREIVDVLE